jgi:hypothetical protein
MFNVAQPNTTDESSPSVSLSYSRRRPGMRGCWILRIGWLRAWHAMGEPEPVDIEELDRKGHYRIKGAAFVFVDRNTRQTRTILGYPTHQLEHVGQG